MKLGRCVVKSPADRAIEQVRLGARHSAPMPAPHRPTPPRRATSQARGNPSPPGRRTHRTRARIVGVRRGPGGRGQIIVLTVCSGPGCCVRWPPLADLKSQWPPPPESRHSTRADSGGAAVCSIEQLSSCLHWPSIIQRRPAASSEARSTGCLVSGESSPHGRLRGALPSDF